MATRSPDEPGEDGHIYAESTVRRSRSLFCTNCKKPLPMGTQVIFELDSQERFVAVYCDTECAPYDYQMGDQRHPFDLED